MLPKERENSERLFVKKRPLEFSFWPVERTKARFGLGSQIFATDPWTIIRRSTEKRVRDKKTREAAFALLEQAEDFFRAAESGVKAAKPLLLYYCFMNLGKAFILAAGNRETVDHARHGLSELLDESKGGKELVDAFLNAKRTVAATVTPSINKPVENFDELLTVFTGAGIPTKKFRFDLPTLLPQVVPGHRLWAEATGKRSAEKFISIEEITFREDSLSKQIWLRLLVFQGDLHRIGLRHSDLLSHSRLDTLFQAFNCEDLIDGRKLFGFESKTPLAYKDRSTDTINELVESVRPYLWRTVLSQRPYRQYYLYPTEPSEHHQVLPQVLSIYAITFYLGSIVRYRPHHFDDILAGQFGPFIEAFLNDQPNQFLYLMASEFAQREVTRAAIV